jgi:hypothetical protein
MLMCSVPACIPVLIVSTALLGTGVWQILPDSSGQQPVRSWLYDVGFVLFQILVLYFVSKFILYRNYAPVIGSLAVSFNRIFFSAALKTIMVGPIVTFAVILTYFVFY